jgi:hypothetical protein
MIVKNKPIRRLSPMDTLISKKGNIITCESRAIKYPTITLVILSNKDSFLD